MSYPSIDAYQDALQSARLVFEDPELKSATVATSALGTPLLRCGGFALTYSVQSSGRRYAVRCFHKEAPDLERRYQLISDHLKQLSSPYFLPFEFRPRGIRVDGRMFPIVKMAWAEGETLGDFLDREHGQASSLRALRESLRCLARYLESHRMAHGDIQPGNVMVTDGGRTLRLIDYDGLFVESLRGQRANELGQANFQHPARTSQNFDERLDRFSFIALDVALQALASAPNLWKQTKSDPDGIVFRVADYRAPASSKTFDLVGRVTGVEQTSKALAAVASATFSSIPTLDDFVNLRNIPQIAVSVQRTNSLAAYLGAFPVLDAQDYAACLSRVGDKVELVGRIVEVSHQKTKSRAKYVFVNFAPWRGKAVKLNIWSEGLKQLSTVPDSSWVGRWISTTGLLEPPYSNPKYGYTHLAITINQASQIHILEPDEAKYRLGGVRTASTPSLPNNSDVIKRMGGRLTSSVAPMPPPAQAQRTPNQQVVDNMRRRSGSQAGTPLPQPQQANPGTVSRPTSPPPEGLLQKAVAWFAKVFS